MPYLSLKGLLESHSSACSRVHKSSLLRIGYTQARPWSYNSHHAVLGHDIAICQEFAQALNVEARFIELNHANLEVALAEREIDIAVGGLVEQGRRAIACIDIWHFDSNLTQDAQRYRRAFFQNMWWIPRHDWRWNLRIRYFLQMRSFAYWLKRVRPQRSIRLREQNDAGFLGESRYK